MSTARAHEVALLVIGPVLHLSAALAAAPGMVLLQEVWEIVRLHFLARGGGLGILV